MSGMTDLEKLCHPVFLRICNYWHLSAVTNMVEMEQLRKDITEILEETRRKAQQDPQLAREYAWIEKPLVFFIDYMVKEGRFSFGSEWVELSRNYNELSGDEKFFDILSETLNYPDLKNSITLFYIMLGLGFDGAYRYKREYVEQCMRLCMEKAYIDDYDIYREPVITPPKKKSLFMRRRKLTVYTALLACAVFMLVCFFINLFVFIDVTKNYRSILEKTAVDAAAPLQMIQAEEK